MTALIIMGSRAVYLPYTSHEKKKTSYIFLKSIDKVRE